MELTNWVKRKIAILSLAMAGVEKDVLRQNNNGYGSSINQERRNTQGTLADSLKQGQLSQEVMELRWRTYKILKAVEGVNVELIGYDSENNPITRLVKTDKKRGLSKVRVDNFDTYEVDMVIDASSIITSGNDVMDNENIDLLDTAIINYNDNGEVISATHGQINGEEYYATHKGVSPLNIIRDCLPKFEIETYTKKLCVRNIDKTNKLLEFYVSMYPDEYDRKTRLLISDIKKAIENPRGSTLLDIKEVGFITYKTLGADDFLEYNYKIKSFDKIIEFNGNYVIKFIAEIDIDGINVLDQFKVDELDVKYDNKEKKKQ